MVSSLRPFDNGYSLDTFPLMYEGRTDDMIFFSNLPEFLDYANEYWFDNNTSTLYVYNAKGDYAVDTGTGAFITLERGAEHISFVGFEFNTSSSSAIFMKADNVTVDMCTIANIGGRAGINASYGINGLTVKNCEMYNCVDCCIDLDGKGNINAIVPGNNVIENNYFHDFTLPQYFSSAITVHQDVGTYIGHNYFYEGGHGGVDYGPCIDLVVEYNVFDRLMTKSADFGAVYHGQDPVHRGNAIRYNIFKNIPVYAIYIDDYTGGQEIYGNIFYNNGSGVVQNCGRGNIIHDNVFIDNNKGGITSNPGFYSYITDGNPDGIKDDKYYKMLLNDVPQKGDPMYEVWFARWPELYSFNIDPEKLGDYDCLFTTVTYLHNNVGFGVVVNNAEMIQMFGDDIGNESYDLDTNPYFVNPAVGNYSIKDGADFADNQFAKIGRY